MKKTFKIITIASLAIAAALIAFVLISVAVSASQDSNISDSISIIGGADGPTAIFITGTLILSHPVCIVGWCFVAIALFSSVGWALSKNK